MKLSSVIVLRPVCVFIFLVFVVLLLPSLVIPYWYHKVGNIEQDVKLNSQNLRVELISRVENTAQLLQPFNSSALNLARVLSSSLNGAEPSFSMIETRVAPMLFQALSILPHLSQISYIGSDGLFFSYYIDGNQILAVYSNTSFAFNSSTTPKVTKNYTWYTQPVSRGMGRLYGEAIHSDPMILVNSSLYLKAWNNSNGSASLGHRWNSDRELVFLNTASMDVDENKGVVSLGFAVKSITKFFSDINFNGGNFYLATKDGNLLLQGIPNTPVVQVVDGDSILLQKLKPNSDLLLDHTGNFSCNHNHGTLNSTIMDVLETKYLVHCSQLDILGVQMVYALAFPRKGIVRLIHKTGKLALMVLIVMIITIVISIFTFMFLIVRAARREMQLCAALIKQMEATQQAERKHLSMSLAFERANHDVRNALACITGLIDLSYHAATPGSLLETNLRQIETCSNDLIRLLNSTLDTSKIEAGQMKLNEEEFNLAKLLEEVVDLYHPKGMEKGVDVVLDPCDSSIMKFSHVKGDRGKLQRILWNLLGNAVKFTDEGHITVRGLAKKSSLEQSILASQHYGFLNRFSRLFFKHNNEALKTMKTVQHNPNMMEFLFEVENTGSEIPEEKRKAVFSNYFQVDETAKQKGGMGLGLGIVQSLVRLMGGEIEIVDRENDEKGTRFRFNAFLTTTNETAVFNDDHNQDDIVNQDDIEGQGGVPLSFDSNYPQHVGLMSIRSPNNPKFDGSSHVVLLIQSEERRRVVYKFMKGLGIRVLVAKQWENLPRILEKVKQKVHLSCHTSSDKSDLSSKCERLSKSSSHNSVGAKDVPLSSMDGTDHVLPIYRRSNNTTRGAHNFVLIIIDTTSGPFSELCNVMANLRNDIKESSEGSFCCQVVWLDNPIFPSIPLEGGGRFEATDSLISPNDLVISKPFHGSRLYQVIRFLPQFGGSSPHNGEIQTDGSASGNEEIRSAKKVPSLKQTSSNQQEKHEVGGIHGAEMPLLNGKKVLVVEDNAVLRRLAISCLSQLGAIVEFCENGKEAFELVSNGLRDRRSFEAEMIIPYDYIFMDCEMPVMNGFESTRMIRKEEKMYGVHIPIIALTAHTASEEAKKMVEAGMDFHLTKPLNKEKLQEAILSIYST